MAEMRMLQRLICSGISQICLQMGFAYVIIPRCETWINTSRPLSMLLMHNSGYACLTVLLAACQKSQFPWSCCSTCHGQSGLRADQ